MTHLVVASMDILKQLFPGLGGQFAGEIPKWLDPGSPWNILQKDKNGIQAQIKNFSENDEKEIVIHPSSVIGDCVHIEGPSYVGPEATIKNGAYLREGSWVCEGAVVGHSSEIKNSILLPNSKAPHFNYVGDSIVGIGANLGAGVKVSNVRHDKRNVIVSLFDGSRVDSGLSKMGALLGDGCKLGCNVVTNPGAIVAPLSMIPPNETVSGWFETKS